MIVPVPGLPIEQQPAIVLLRLCLWGEARGEPAIGKLGVAWVIRNRADKHNLPLNSIILQPLQFSSFNSDDPNREKLLSAPQTDPAGYGICDAVAELFIAKATVDPTLGATHYYVSNMPNPPSWADPAKGWEVTAVLGKQTFGRAA